MDEVNPGDLRKPKTWSSEDSTLEDKWVKKPEHAMIRTARIRRSREMTLSLQKKKLQVRLNMRPSNVTVRGHRSVNGRWKPETSHEPFKNTSLYNYQCIFRTHQKHAFNSNMDTATLPACSTQQKRPHMWIRKIKASLLTVSKKLDPLANQKSWSCVCLDRQQCFKAKRRY